MSDSISVSHHKANKKRTGQPRQRTIARAGAVQALFQYEQSGDSVDLIILQFNQHRGGGHLEQFEEGRVPEADMLLLGKIVRKAALNQEKIDAELSEILPKQWPLKQIDSVLRAILRAALAELNDGLPTAVTINEYMDVTHAFLSDETARMLNGILETAAKRREAVSKSN
ncbi:transcription antitermination factor NusB [Acetobacteraceae bacterium]|nr:transcription antitermination factor NusB [Acetobacteraceae bacterium]